MRGYIEQRVMQVAGYILETGATVRDAAKQFGVSKSTIHKDVCDRLQRLNLQLYRQNKEDKQNKAPNNRGFFSCIEGRVVVD